MRDAELSAESLVERYAQPAPDGVHFLQLGKLPRHVRPGSTTAFRYVVEGFQRPGWSVVGDLAGGLRQASFGWAGFASLVAVVVEPSAAALLTARRLGALAELMPAARLGLVLNKLRPRADGFDRDASAGLPVWGEVPYDAAVVEAEASGRAPLDAAAGSTAVRAIARLAETLRGAEAGNRETGA
jgi:CO dehydrogenase maturation factor